MPKDVPNPKAKKLPKWAIPVGIAGVLAVVIVAKKHKPTQGKATEPGSEGLTNQSFIPVTGENVPGAGANFYPQQSSNNNESTLVTFLKEQQAEAASVRAEQRQEGREALERESSFYQGLLANLGTGGGAQTSGGVPGISIAPPPEAATPPSPPPVVAPPGPVPSKGTCPSSYPIWNPANGAPGPHSCYRYSREGCKAPYPFKHAYEDGHSVCASV